MCDARDTVAGHRVGLFAADAPFPARHRSGRLPSAAVSRGACTSTDAACPAAPELYFVGTPFFHPFASRVILGAGRDGKRVAEHIVARARMPQSATPLPNAFAA